VIHPINAREFEGRPAFLVRPVGCLDINVLGARGWRANASAGKVATTAAVNGVLHGTRRIERPKIAPLAAVTLYFTLARDIRPAVPNHVQGHDRGALAVTGVISTRKRRGSAMLAESLTPSDHVANANWNRLSGQGRREGLQVGPIGQQIERLQLA
jgi:hypothetical protein